MEGISKYTAEVRKEKGWEMSLIFGKEETSSPLMRALKSGRNRSQISDMSVK